jgi:hypothetical protein
MPAMKDTFNSQPSVPLTQNAISDERLSMHGDVIN